MNENELPQDPELDALLHRWAEQRRTRKNLDPLHGRIMAVRIVVARRSAGQRQWEPVWAVDLVAPQEQVVHLTPEAADLPDGAELSLWTYAADDQMIAVDSSLALTGLPVESVFSGLQRSGVPTVIQATERNGVEYRVFQTVAVLNGSEA